MKKVLHGTEAREAILRGVDILANAVKATLGPKGLLVALDRRAIGQSPMVTKDGVTVANNTSPADPVEMMGADLVREAAQRTVDKAGDGTTTATLLAQALIHFGLRALAAGFSPADIKEGMEKALSLVLAEIDKMSINPVSDEQVVQIATISANGDSEVGNLVAEASKRVGKDGAMSIEAGRNLTMDLEVVDGLQLPAGYASYNFITNGDRMVAEFDKPLIFLYEGRLGSAKALRPLLELVQKEGRPLVVIAGGFEDEALAFFVINRLKALMQLCCVNAPAYGDRRKEILRDIAVLTGARAITQDIGMKVENVTLDDLGTAKRIEIDNIRTTIKQGNGKIEDIQGRVVELRKKIETATDPAEKAHLSDRLAGLTGGVAVIKVGAPTEVEMREKKDRVEDSMYAVKAAVEGGAVVGGGVALLRAADYASFNRPTHQGEKIVFDACSEPIKQIARNAGKPADAVVEKVRENNNIHSNGFNARTGVYEDLVAAGVLDPTNVVKEALKNAVSVAKTVLSIEAMVAEVPEEEKK